MDNAIFLALFVGFLWGLAPIVHKILLKNIDFKLFMVLSSLTFFTCTCLFAAYFWKDLLAEKKKLNFANVAWIVITAIVTGFIANLIYLFVLKDNKSYVVSALIYCSPFFTLALSYLFLKNEKITYIGASGCILITLGVILIALDH